MAFIRDADSFSFFPISACFSENHFVRIFPKCPGFTGPGVQDRDVGGWPEPSPAGEASHAFPLALLSLKLWVMPSPFRSWHLPVSCTGIVFQDQHARQPCCCFPTTLKHNPFILYHKKNHRPNEMRARVALAQHQKGPGGRSPSGARFRHIIASKVPKSERSKVQSGPKLHCFGRQFSSWVGVIMPRSRWA